jgi:hypothetical protein
MIIEPQEAPNMEKQGGGALSASLLPLLDKGI